ncbi:MAG: 30S ribosomal protein S2 [Candidatus Neomarinimicrobiota bacterium]
MNERVTFNDLLSTGAHFGHVTQKWHPNYKPFILMERNGVHIINLDETVKQLNSAINFISEVVKNNGEILFVGTKKQARDIVQQEADKCGMFYVVERWLGGTLTNFSTIKKSIKRLQLLEKEGSSIYENLTKKEIQMLNRERIKLSDQHRGIKDMRRLPDAIVIVDTQRESTALLEALRLEIPVVAIVDSNSDPRPITYPIPANDDSIRTVQIIISAISDTIIENRSGSKESIEPGSQDEKTIQAEELGSKTAGTSSDKKESKEGLDADVSVDVEIKPKSDKSKPTKKPRSELKSKSEPEPKLKKTVRKTDKKEAPQETGSAKVTAGITEKSIEKNNVESETESESDPGSTKKEKEDKIEK